MPDFNVHFAAGALSGGAVGVWGAATGDLGMLHAGAVAVLGTTGGLLPDLDSDSGKPLALLFQLISVLLPVLLYPYARSWGGQDIPFLICYYTAAYFVINYLVMPMVKKATRHRGMMHSVPFALAAGEAAFLLLLPSGLLTAIYAGLAVLTGGLAHLVLDTFPSIGKASGNALKFKSQSLIGTLSVYALLIVMGIPMTERLLPLLRPALRRLLSL
jgi:membrane-bound metal-dependent hydrolase YbcI (DUF457 family)